MILMLWKYHSGPSREHYKKSFFVCKNGHFWNFSVGLVVHFSPSLSFSKFPHKTEKLSIRSIVYNGGSRQKGLSTLCMTSFVLRFWTICVLCLVCKGSCVVSNTQKTCLVLLSLPKNKAKKVVDSSKSSYKTDKIFLKIHEKWQKAMSSTKQKSVKEFRLEKYGCRMGMSCWPSQSSY